jgi:hypothetical protein
MLRLVAVFLGIAALGGATQAALADARPSVSTCIAVWNGKSNHLRRVIAPRSQIGVVMPFLAPGAAAAHRSGCEFTFFGPKFSVLVEASGSTGHLRWGRALIGRERIGDATPNALVLADGRVARIRR